MVTEKAHAEFRSGISNRSTNQDLLRALAGFPSDDLAANMRCRLARARYLTLLHSSFSFSRTPYELSTEFTLKK